MTHRLTAVLLALAAVFPVAMADSLRDPPLMVAFADEEEEDEDDSAGADEAATPSAAELREWAMRRRENRGDSLPAGYDSVVPRTFHAPSHHTRLRHHRGSAHGHVRHGERHGSTHRPKVESNRKHSTHSRPKTRRAGRSKHR